MDRETVLTTGSGGMIGGYVDFGIVTNHDMLDVTDLDQVLSLCRQHRPKVILHLAAATDLDRCEKEPDYAYKVNTVGTYHMALAAREVGALLVFVSTTSVFDGNKKDPYTVDDVPSPVNIYGHSKYLAECAIRSILEEHLIVRVTWVFGGGSNKDKKFVGHILRQINKEDVKVVSGKRGSPIYGKDAVEGIVSLIEHRQRGTVHLFNSGVATRVDMAREVLLRVGSTAKIIEVPEGSFKSVYESGDNDSMMSDIVSMRPWRDALRDYIETEWSI